MEWSKNTFERNVMKWQKHELIFCKCSVSLRADRGVSPFSRKTIYNKNMIPLCYILNILMYPLANHGILSQCPGYFKIKIEAEANCMENPVSSILHILNSLQNWLLNIAAVGGRVINEASGKPPRKWASAETIDTELWSKHLKCKCPFHSNSAGWGCISATGTSPGAHCALIWCWNHLINKRCRCSNWNIYIHADGDALRQGIGPVL